MTNFDPALGIKLPERSYASNCETTLENIMVMIGWKIQRGRYEAGLKNN
jgi:hypothetical protein